MIQFKSKCVPLKKRIIITLIGNLSFFGEKEILENTKRTTQARCLTTKVKLFRIHKKAIFSFKYLNVEEFRIELNRRSHSL